MDPGSIDTIGHSTRSFEDFLALLKREGVAHLADVRAFPASRRHPHFNGDAMASALAEQGIGYSHFSALGGRRTPRPDSKNVAWRNESFRAYADYMETTEFEDALTELVSLGTRQRTAIMCAEAVPWRCHRSLISDALTARGIQVLHILDSATKPHTLTSFARVESGRVHYDGGAQSELFKAG